MYHCLRDLTCTISIHNIADSHCHLGHDPCPLLESECDVETIHMAIQVPYLPWIRQHAVALQLDNIFEILTYLKEEMGKKCCITRTILYLGKTCGKFHNRGYFSSMGRFYIIHCWYLRDANRFPSY